MAQKRRTRAQKERTEAHRSTQFSYTHQAQRTVGTPPSEVVLKTTPRSGSMSDLFNYDYSLIYRDLQKTVLITVAVLAVLLGVKLGIH